MGKLYERVNWEDKPSTKTPTSAANFNKMDKGIDDLDNKLVEQEAEIESLALQVEQIASNQIPEEYLNASVDAYIDEKGAGLATDEELEAVNSQLSSEIAELDNRYITKDGSNKYNVNDVNNEKNVVINTLGEITSELGENFILSNFIPTNEGDVWRARNFKTENLQNPLQNTFRYAWFDENKNFISTNGNENVESIIAPSGAKYLRFGENYTLKYGRKVMLTQNEGITAYEDYHTETLLKKEHLPLNDIFTYINSRGVNITSNASGLVSGGSIVLQENNTIKKNQTLVFYGKITDFESIKVGKGFTAYGGSYVVVNSSKILVYRYTSAEQLIATLEHGLSISEYICVILEMGAKGGVKITLSTLGGMYSQEVDASSRWEFSNGEIAVKASNASLYDCKLTWYCKDYAKPIYAFGDSYFSLWNNERWTYHVAQLGYDNWLLDGFAGRTSSKAIQSVKDAFSKGKPKFALWAMGMNDPDSETEINAEWLSATETFITLCNANDIEPILCVLPNCSGAESEDSDVDSVRINTFKNDYVKNSGYRYIDFYTAVGASENGAWKDGLLSDDEIHPTENGAIALMSKALVDFPEIIGK